MLEKLKNYNITEEDIVWFDCESFEDPENYYTLLNDLLQITKTKIQFSNIEYTYGHSKQKDPKLNYTPFIVHILFIYRAIKYKLKILCEEWFDLDVITELNAIISKDTSYRFCPIKTNDQSMIIVFVDEPVLKLLEKDNLIETEYHIEKPSNWKEMNI